MPDRWHGNMVTADELLVPGDMDLAEARSPAATFAQRGGTRTAEATSVDAASNNVSAVNEAPVLGIAEDISLTIREGLAREDLANGAYAFDRTNSFTLTDADSSDFAGGEFRVTLSGAASSSEGFGFELTSRGGRVTWSGSGDSFGPGVNASVTVDGVVIGTVTSSGRQGTDLAIALNANATAARVQILLQDVGYLNSSGLNDPSPRTATITVTDGDGGSASASLSVINENVNNPPRISPLGGIMTDGNIWVEANNGPSTPVAVSSDLVVRDNDGGGLPSATVQISGAMTGDVLAFVNDDVARYGNIAVTGFAGNVLSLASAGSTATQAQWSAALNAVTFNTTAEDPGSSRTIIYFISDGTASGRWVAQLNIQAVNDTPSGTDGNVSVAQNGSAALTVANFGFTDVDGDALVAVVITTLPTAGALTLDGAAVTAGQSIVAADIAAGRLVFTPAPNVNADDYASFTFQVRDNGGTANGGIDTDQTPNTLTFDVVPPANAPQVTVPASISGSEDQPIAFADFGPIGVTDLDSTMLQISASVADGGFRFDFDGSPGFSGNAFDIGLDVGSIDQLLRSLVYVPDADVSGTREITLAITDGETTINRVVTVEIAAVNDAPSGTNGSVTLDEDGTHAITLEDLGYGDLEGDAFSAVRISTLPSAGTLTLDGVAAVAGQLVSAEDVAAGRLVFAPAANANGTGYASLTFQVQDDGGTANGGVDIDPTPNTLTFDVTAVNDAPVLSGIAGRSVTINEGRAVNTNLSLPGYSLSTNTTLSFSDADDTNYSGARLVVALSDNADPVMEYVILAGERAQTEGVTWTGSSRGVGPGSIISVGGVVVGTVISGGLNTINEDLVIEFTANATVARVQKVFASLGYINNSEAPGTDPRTLTVTLTDPHGASSSASMTITNVPFDDWARIRATEWYYTWTEAADGPSSPIRVGQHVQILYHEENDLVSGTVAINNAQPEDVLSFVNDDATLYGDLTATFENGVLSFSSAGLATGEQWQNAFRAVTYNNLSDSPGVSGRWLTFSVRDATHALYPAAQGRAAISFNPANDSPSGTSSTITVGEDGSHVLTGADFGFTDVDGNGLAAVIVTTLPSAGALTLDGVAVTAGQEIAAADIAAGMLVFTPAPNVNAEGYASFDFQLRDDGGTANGGIDTDPTPNTITFDVVPPANAPQVSLPAVISGAEDQPIALADFGPVGVTDLDSEFLQLTVSVEDGGFQFDFNGFPSSSGNSIDIVFNAATIDQLLRSLVYIPATDVSGMREITISITDGETTITRVITVEIAAVNDAPTGTNGSVTLDEDGTYAIALDDFGYSDAEGDAFTAVTISTLPTAGALTLDGVAVTEGQSIAVADIAAGLLIFTPAPDGNGAGYTELGFRVQNGSVDANISVDEATIRFDVLPVDDPVTAVDDVATIAENATVVIDIHANDMDPDGGPAETITHIDGQAIAVGGSVTLASGAIVTLNLDGTVTYDPNHRFDALVSAARALLTGAQNSSALDGFNYTLSGGGSASVNVTVTGVDGIADQLLGSALNDIMTGTNGSDFFRLDQGGSDRAIGGAGDDAFLMGAMLDAYDEVDGGTGSNQLALQGNTSVALLDATVTNIGTMVFLSGADTRFGLPGSDRFAYSITTADGTIGAGQTMTFNANTLLSGEDVFLDASAELDGNLVFYAGQGADTVIGGAGADAFFFGTDGRFAATDRIDGGLGNDQLALRGDYSAPITLNADTFTNIETLVLMSSTDLRYGSPTSASSYALILHDGNVGAGQVLTINANMLTSGETVQIDGSAEVDGAFIFYGGAGDDVFIGGAGDDRIYGRLGQDAMTGGAGNDTFYFRSIEDSRVGSEDRIFDFAAGDRIDLSAIDANTTQAGNDAFDYIGDAAFSGQAGELRVMLINGSWVVEGDVNGDGVADFAIRVDTQSGHAMGAGDFGL